MAFVKAVREKVYLKVLLTGASGSGKSQSALEMKLDKMLSDGKKTELELDEIATLLK